MKSFLEFLKTTLVGGALFLLPLIVTLVLLGHAFRATAKILGPVARAIPAPTILGIALADVLAIVALVALCFLSGLIARTEAGKRVGNWAEDLVLKKIPGFTLLKSMIRGDEKLGTDAEVSVVLAEMEGGHALGFVVERHASGTLTVFVPSAPTPTAGSIFYFPEERVKRLDVTVKSAVQCIMRLGIGSNKLLDRAGNPGNPA